MAIAVNLLALLLVVGISWLGMMWMAGRVHGRVDEAPPGPDLEPYDAERDGSFDLPADQSAGPSHARSDEPCGECGGIGAKQRLGRLEPCPVCEGTGVDRATF